MFIFEDIENSWLYLYIILNVNIVSAYPWIYRWTSFAQTWIHIHSTCTWNQVPVDKARYYFVFISKISLLFFQTHLDVFYRHRLCFNLLIIFFLTESVFLNKHFMEGINFVPIPRHFVNKGKSIAWPSSFMYRVPPGGVCWSMVIDQHRLPINSIK